LVVVVVVAVVNRPAHHNRVARTDMTATAIRHEMVQYIAIQRKRPEKCDTIIITSSNRPAHHDRVAHTDTTATAIRHEMVQYIVMKRKRPENCDTIIITSSNRAKERSGEKPPGELP
jgi:uroporphyrinogen-III synthase